MDQLDIEFLKNTDSLKWYLNHGWTALSYLALQRIIREIAVEALEGTNPIKERVEQIFMQYEINKEQELMIVEALADLTAIAQNKLEQEGDGI